MAETTKPKKKYRKGIVCYTRVCTMGYSNVYTPDTEGEYATGKYDAKVFFDSEAELAEVGALALKEAAIEWPKAKPANVLMPWTDGTAYNDSRVEDGKERFDNYDGRFILKAKTKNKPAIFDSNGVALPSDIKVMSGDRVRLKIELGANTAGGTKRVSPRLCAIQLIEKRAEDGTSESFDSYEGGFVASDNATDQSGGDDEDEF